MSFEKGGDVQNDAVKCLFDRSRVSRTPNDTSRSIEARVIQQPVARFAPTANRDFVRRHPVATKRRALRAIMKATSYCATDPEQVARLLAGKGYQFDYALQTMNEIRYALWREYDPEDAVRFYSLRLREAGMINRHRPKSFRGGPTGAFSTSLSASLKG